MILLLSKVVKSDETNKDLSQTFKTQAENLPDTCDKAKLEKFLLNYQEIFETLPQLNFARNLQDFLKFQKDCESGSKNLEKSLKSLTANENFDPRAFTKFHEAATEKSNLLGFTGPKLLESR